MTDNFKGPYNLRYMDFKKYLIGGIIGAGLIFSVQVFAFPAEPIKTTLQGVYDLLIGKLNFISGQLKNIQDSCAQRAK